MKEKKGIKQVEEDKKNMILEKEEKINKEQKNIEEEKESQINKNINNENIQNNIIGAMEKQLLFDEDIRKKLENKDSDFLVSCSMINKEWFKKFLEFSNYESLKQKVSQNPKNADEIIKKAINDKTIKMDEINNLIKEKPPQPINAKALENIDNLAFVDDDFAAQILNLGQINNKDKINSNINNSNNIIINNNNGINDNQISNQPLKANIMIDKATAAIQLNDQKLICANISENNLNKLQNIEVYNFPEKRNFNLFNLFEKIKKVKNQFHQ